MTMQPENEMKNFIKVFKLEIIIQHREMMTGTRFIVINNALLTSIFWVPQTWTSNLPEFESH